MKKILFVKMQIALHNIHWLCQNEFDIFTFKA